MSVRSATVSSRWRSVRGSDKNRVNKKGQKKKQIAIRGDRTLDHTVKSRALYRLS